MKTQMVDTVLQIPQELVCKNVKKKKKKLMHVQHITCSINKDAINTCTCS